jgi:hypothetical protein
MTKYHPTGSGASPIVPADSHNRSAWPTVRSVEPSFSAEVQNGSVTDCTVGIPPASNFASRIRLMTLRGHGSG